MSKLVNKIKTYFNNLSFIYKNTHNIFGFECPDCCNNFPASAKSYHMYDEQYKCYKFYIKCRVCGRVTPAMPTFKEALDKWEDQWVLKEDKVLMGDTNDKD